LQYAVEAALVAAAYILGSVPVGLLVARAAKGIDIREHGSKNIGATNVGRVCGRGWGILVWLLDTLKGFAPVMAAGVAAGHHWSDYSLPLVTVLCGVAAICGHSFSVFLRFRGGKGVSTSFGVFLYLFPIGLVIAATTWVVTVLITKYVSVGSMLGAVALVLCALVFPKHPFGDALPLTVVCLLIATLIFVRHRGNIQRLLRGQENKVRLGKGKAAEEQAAGRR
jgi:acyl phosphate:glycerol-3-phosphate acyltransferase